LLFSLKTLPVQHAFYTTVASLKSGPENPVWLIATISPASSLQRRSIIRGTWQTLYQNDSLITTRFVLANPGERWAAIVAQENATYGDLIVLPHLEESAGTANTVKSVEFFKYLTQQRQRWQFVSKVDDDSFINVPAFYTDFLAPLTIHTEVANNSRTAIARELEKDGYKYPGGQFYTMTWDLVELLAALHRQKPITNEHEDVLVGRLLHEAHEPWDLVPLSNQSAFDYSSEHTLTVNGKETAWAALDADLTLWSHGVGAGAINPHKMRADDEYLKVAACFGKDGLLDNGVRAYTTHSVREARL
jgi:beta-1,3-galactosyltransferase 1